MSTTRNYVFVRGLDQDVDGLLESFEADKASANEGLKQMVDVLEARKEAYEKGFQQSFWRPLFDRLQTLNRLPDVLAFQDVSLGVSDGGIYYAVEDKDTSAKDGLVHAIMKKILQD